MKKLLFLFLLFAAFQGKAQSVIKASIQLKDSTINRSVTFEVPAGADKLEFFSKSFLSEGNLTLRLLNPEGNSESGFQLSTSEGEKKQRTKSSQGEVWKTIKSPMPGIWKLNIKCRNSNGEINYKITKS